MYLKNIKKCFAAAICVAATTIFADDVQLDKSFDQPGDYTFIVPDGVTEVECDAVGGGGSGGKGGYHEDWRPERKNLHVSTSHEHHGGTHIDQNWSNIEHIKGPARVKMNGGSCGNSEWIANHHHNPHGRRRTDGAGLPWGQYHHLPTPGQWEEWRSGEDRMFGIAVGGPGFRWDDCDQTLDVEYLDAYYAFGLNGSDGAAIRSKMITNLQPGDVLKITVGAGGRDSKGGDTRIVLFDQNNNQKSITLSDGSIAQQLLAVGGARGSDGKDKSTVAPDYTPIELKVGAGGHGSRKLGADGDNGIDGRVKLTYVQATTGEKAALLAWQTYVLTRQIGDYTRELGMSVEHANKLLHECVQLACESDSTLKAALDYIKELRDGAQFSNEALNRALGRFEELLFEAVSKNPQFFRQLLSDEASNVMRITE